MSKNLPIEQTLIILKPDVLKRGLVGVIFERFEQTGLKLLSAKMVKPEREVIQKHYPGTTEWITEIGQKTLASFKKARLDVKKVMKTDDPYKLGFHIYERLIKYWQEGPIIVSVWAGPNAVDIARKLRGHTIPYLADAGTLHSAYSFDSSYLAAVLDRATKTFVHASGDTGEAEREIKYWFGKTEFKSYKREVDSLYLA